MAVADPEVRISSGRIRGRTENGMAVFRGIPFAGPPPIRCALGEVMRGEWVRFATCGDPGWPSYGTQHRSTRIYDSPPDVAPYPEEASMRIWERHQFDTLGLASG